MDKKKITLELNLLDNAFDSLGEAIIKLCNQQEKITNLKFAILHIAHFVELFLKYYVTKQHKLLIYTNPSKVSQDQIKKGDATTITLDQAICILKKCNIDIGSALESDVNTLKEHRNKIMHYKFNIEKEDTEKLLGKIICDFLNFDRNYLNIGIEDEISAEHKEKISRLLQDTTKRLEMALNSAQQFNEEAGYDQEVEPCPACGYETLKILENKDSVQCAFCDFTGYYIECTSCQKIYPDNNSFSIDYENCSTCDSCCHESDYGDYLHDVMKEQKG